MSAAGLSSTHATTRVAWYAVNIFWYLGFVGLLLVMLLMTAMLTTNFHPRYVHLPLEVTVDASQGETLQPVVGASGSIPITAFRDLTVEAAGLRGLEYVLLMPCLLLLGYLGVAYQARAFLKSLRAGAPFADENARRIRNIGLTLMAAGPVYGLMNHIYGRVYMGQVDIPGATIEAPFDVHPFIMLLGLLVLVVAHAFRVASAMRREQELTI